MKHLSKIGAFMLLAALVFAWHGWTWIALGMLLAVGILDLFLVIAKQDTISQWVHRLFPKWMDVVIQVGLLVFTWFIFGPEGFLPVMLGVISGHLFWDS